MKTSLKNLILLVSTGVAFLSATSILAATTQKTFSFTGQSFENVSLQTTSQETGYRTVERDSTCTRQVPYTVRECHDEIRNREECSYGPSRQECRVEYQDDCSYETRYREECTNRPSHVECEMVNGRRICRTIDGGRECRRVPYNERVCRQVARNVCRNIPGEYRCRNISYNENVCDDVTHYRTEEYRCTETTQVPYSYTKRVEADVNFEFVDNSGAARADFKVKLNGQNISVTAVDRSETPMLAIATISKDSDDFGDELTRVTATYKVKFVKKSSVGSTVGNYAISNVSLDDEELSFIISGQDPRMTKAQIKIFDVTANESVTFCMISEGMFTTFRTGNGDLGVSVKLSDIKADVTYGHKFKVELKAKVLGTTSVDGTILNEGASIPSGEKEIEVVKTSNVQL